MTIGTTTSFTEALLNITHPTIDPETTAFKERQQRRHSDLSDLREKLDDAFWSVPEAEHGHRQSIQSIIDTVDQQQRGINRTLAALDLAE